MDVVFEKKRSSAIFSGGQHHRSTTIAMTSIDGFLNGSRADHLAITHSPKTCHVELFGINRTRSQYRDYTDLENKCCHQSRKDCHGKCPCAVLPRRCGCRLGHISSVNFCAMPEECRALAHSCPPTNTENTGRINRPESFQKIEGLKLLHKRKVENLFRHAASCHFSSSNARVGKGLVGRRPVCFRCHRPGGPRHRLPLGVLLAKSGEKSCSWPARATMAMMSALRKSTSARTAPRYSWMWLIRHRASKCLWRRTQGDIHGLLMVCLASVWIGRLTLSGKKLIKAINGANRPILAVDVPSGTECRNGRCGRRAMT